MHDGVPLHRIVLGCAAVTGFLLIFAAGMLLPSKIHRDRLRSAPSEAVATAGVGAAADAGATDWRAFGMAILLYTPLNVALLTLLAGFIGGCASNITFDRAVAKGVVEPSAGSAAAAFRTENPFASMFRSFVVYLALIGGISIAGDSPFAEPTAEQYVRFATSVSLLAFTVGYDPTKLQQFLSYTKPKP
jgi:hypothetical protein